MGTLRESMRPSSSVVQPAMAATGVARALYRDGRKEILAKRGIRRRGHGSTACACRFDDGNNEMWRLRAIPIGRQDKCPISDMIDLHQCDWAISAASLLQSGYPGKSGTGDDK